MITRSGAHLPVPDNWHSVFVKPRPQSSKPPIDYAAEELNACDAALEDLSDRFNFAQRPLPPPSQVLGGGPGVLEET